MLTGSKHLKEEGLSLFYWYSAQQTWDPPEENNSGRV